ncbi:Cytochrome c oxidase caa3 assembly factor [compost metagenome]
MKNDVPLFAYHTMLLVTAFIMWFPVFCPLPELNRLNDLKKMAYIFGNGVLLTPACALIIFADTIIYDMYDNVTVPFAHLSPLDDQQLGGVIMKILQEIIYGATLAYIFFRWYRRERKDEDELDPLPSQESMNNQGGNWNRA